MFYITVVAFFQKSGLKIFKMVWVNYLYTKWDSELIYRLKRG